MLSCYPLQSSCWEWQFLRLWSGNFLSGWVLVNDHHAGAIQWLVQLTGLTFLACVCMYCCSLSRQSGPVLPSSTSLFLAVQPKWRLLPLVAAPSGPSDGSLGSAAQQTELNLVPWLQICTFNHSSWVDAMLIMWLFAPSGGSQHQPPALAQTQH